MATLVFKLGALTLKTLSKPLAARFESYVLAHPTLRGRVISIAQSLHRMEVGINRGAEGKTGRAFVGDMSEERAVQLASKVVSEGFLYATAVGLLLLEMDRKRREDNVKKAKELAEKEAIRSMHEAHSRAEQTLERRQRQLEEVLQRVDDRLGRLEESLAAGNGSRRRWLLF